MKYMGKKRVVKKTKEELLKEKERMEAALKKGVQTKTQRNIQEGRVYISSSYNNTFLTLTDAQGNTLTWASAGNAGFKGTKKGTPFAASKVAEILVQRAQQLGVEKVKVLVKGIGSGRESAIRSLINKGLTVTSIEDVTPIPHNGCRPPKPRRV